MPLVVKEYEPLDPMAIGLFSPAAVMAGAEGFAETIQKFRFLNGLRSKMGVSADWI
jgi:hypothetical protein